MSTREVIEERCRIIAAQFDLEESGEEEAALEDREQRFRQLLIERIIALLSRDPELLMHILYRIDVAKKAGVTPNFTESHVCGSMRGRAISWAQKCADRRKSCRDYGGTSSDVVRKTAKRRDASAAARIVG